VPRNRIIKPDFWADEKIGKLSSSEKLFYIGLWNFCDDIGIIRANKAYLKSNIFPYDEKITVKKVSSLCNALLENGFILIKNHNKESFFLVKNFLKHQKIDRPSAFRFIEGTERSNVLDLFVSSSPRDILATYSLPNVNVNVNDNVKDNGRDFDFDKIYAAYPRHEGKKKGFEICMKEIKTKKDYDSLSKAVNNYNMVLNEEGRAIKHTKLFSTFMGCWEDYVETDQTVVEDKLNKIFAKE